MENKTIGYLNSKIWFRALKVIFLIFFTPIFILINLYPIFNFNNHKTLSLENTIVTCDSGKKFSLKETGWYFSENEFTDYNYDIFSKVHTIDAESLIQKCDGKVTFNDWIHNNTSNQNWDEFQGITSPSNVVNNGAPLTHEQLEQLKLGMIFNPPEPTMALISNFNLNINYSYSSPVSLYLQFFLLGNAMAISALFLLRGIFYYIVLGKFNPKD